MYAVQKQQFVCREQQKNETAGSTKLPLLKQLFYCPPVVRALSAHTLLVHVIQFYSTFELLVPVHNELIRLFVFMCYIICYFLRMCSTVYFFILYSKADWFKGGKGISPVKSKNFLSRYISFGIHELCV